METEYQEGEDETKVRDVIYPVVLVLLPFLFFLPGALNTLMLGDGDAFVQFLPFWQYVAEQWRNLAPAFWTPHIFGGFPLMAEPQAGVFHPNKLLFLLFSPLTAMNLTVLIYYGVAGLFTYLLAREERLTPEGSLLAGITFAFSGFLIGHQAITALFITAASFPIAFYVLRVSFRRGTYKSLLWGVLAVLFLVLNGHPQFTFFALFFSLFYAGYLLVFVETRALERWAFLKRAVVIYVLGAGLAAFQLLPTAELTLRSVRERLTYSEFVGLSLPPPTLLTSLWSTRIYHLFPSDGSEAMLDVGVWVLLLAATAVWMSRKRSVFWIFLFVYSGLLFVGSYTPLYKIMFWVPGYNLFRLASRNGIAVDFSVAMLAGYGLTALQARPRVAGKSAKVLLFAAVPCLYFLLIYRPEQRIFDSLYRAVAALGGALPWNLATLRDHLLPLWPQAMLMGLGTVAILFLLRRFAAGAAFGILATAIALSHFAEYRNWIFAAPAAEVAKSLQEKPQAASFPGVLGGTPARVALGGPSNWINFLREDQKTWRTRYVNVGGVDINMLHGVHSVNGYTPLILADYSRFAGGMHMSGIVSDPAFFSSAALDLLNVRYVVAPAGGLSFPRETFSRLELWRESEVASIFVNPRASGFVRAAQALKALPEEEFWSKLRTGSDEFQTTAYVTDPRDHHLASQTLGMPTKLEATFETPSKIVAVVDAPATVYLTFSQQYYPGWFATIDGKKVEVNRVNGILCGLQVPPGTHRIVLRFIPVTFWIGLFVSLLSLAALGVISATDLLRLNGEQKAAEVGTLV